MQKFLDDNFANDREVSPYAAFESVCEFVQDFERVDVKAHYSRNIATGERECMILVLFDNEQVASIFIVEVQDNATHKYEWVVMSLDFVDDEVDLQLVQ